MNYYLFRINYDDRNGGNFSIIRGELLQGRLRQGWGAEGMAVSNSEQNFLAARVKAWGSFANVPVGQTKDYHIRKYHNLHTMLDIKVGDLIVIPKVSLNNPYVGRYFTVAKCTEEYKFNVLQGVNDFGHIIGVENLFSCDYDFNSDSQIICGKLRAYQSSINNVLNEDFKNAVDNLIKNYTTNPQNFSSNNVAQSSLDMLAQDTKNERVKYLQEIVKSLRKLPPNTLEDIIKELFVKNGHKLIRRNFYNRKGGDVDLVFETFPENTLMHDIFKVGEDESKIFIQVKKKVGTDLDDTTGINQLNQMNADNGRNNICILINLTDEFTDKAKQSASETNVILIDGLTMADIIVRRGIPVGI